MIELTAAGILGPESQYTSRHTCPEMQKLMQKLLLHCLHDEIRTRNLRILSLNSLLFTVICAIIKTEETL